ncbi:MAG: phosphatase PAP2 family protein [Acidobacteriota bacterium]|nr:phosphatase PAP2 family protein [Acidobacteriota bacterium]
MPGFLLADVTVLPPKGLNTTVYLHLNNLARHSAWAHGFMHAYALWLGMALLVLGFAAAYALAWWRRSSRAAGLLALGGVGTIAAFGCNQLVGHAARELRPYDTHPHALVLVSKANDYSFPSDHSVLAGALITSLLLVTGRALWSHRGAAVAWLVAAEILLGLFLCFARLYVGAHYLGDVVAGLLLGAVVVGALSLLRPVLYKVIGVLEPTVLGTLVRRPPAMAPDRPPSS